MIYLDTHVVAWLYQGDPTKFSPKARRLIEQESLVISPIVQMELAYLREIKRVKEDPCLIIATLSQSIGLAVCELPFNRVILEALGQHWTRDPFDRIIVAQAGVNCARLLTKDRALHRQYAHAMW